MVGGYGMIVYVVEAYLYHAWLVSALKEILL